MEKEDTKKDHKKHGHGAPQHGRAHDRRDGTGRGQVQQKKGGGGAHNWYVGVACFFDLRLLALLLGMRKALLLSIRRLFLLMRDTATTTTTHTHTGARSWTWT